MTADDLQRIFAAALTVEGEAVVAYGSTIRPAIATVKFTQPDGTTTKLTLTPTPTLSPTLTPTPTPTLTPTLPLTQAQ